MSVGIESLSPNSSQAAATTSPQVPPLVAGDCLTQEEFLVRYEAMPQLRKAELINPWNCLHAISRKCRAR
jgi:hypothetical protein